MTTPYFNRDNILLMAHQRMYTTPLHPLDKAVEYALLKHLDEIKTNYPTGSEDMLMSINALLRHYSL